MNHSKRPFLCVLLVSILLAVSFSGTVSAGELSDPAEQTGSVSLSLYESGEAHTPVPGAVFTIHKVADVHLDGTALRFTPTAAFAASGVAPQELGTEAPAVHLAAYAAVNGLTGSTADAGEGNTVVFSPLTPGLYLLVQTVSVDGYYPCTPFLVSIPIQKVDDGVLYYHVDASPKAEVLPTSPNERTRLKVIKHWLHGADTCPESVTVQLLRDYVVYETVVLNAANEWTHTWEDLSAAYAWSVAETGVPPTYRVKYEIAGKTVFITNQSVSYTPPTEPSQDASTPPGEPTTKPGRPTPGRPTRPPRDDTPPLIHTGQLTWPIPVLAVSGILLFAFGWIITARKGNKKRG